MPIETEEGIKQCKLIAVHAGLEKDKSVEEQIKLLKAKDTSVPKIGPLSGRHSVWDIPEVSHRLRLSWLVVYYVTFGNQCLFLFIYLDRNSL